MKVSNYKPRLIDKKLDQYLKIFGAVLIEGPKWCGKTWTGLNQANSVVYLTNKEEKNKALINPRLIFSEDNLPQLIDEWQIVPDVWDAIRHECDLRAKPNQFILTGSTSYSYFKKNNNVFHSGTGRIIHLKMYTLSSYEFGDSDGKISLCDLFNNKFSELKTKQISIENLANIIIRGGWPASLNVDAKSSYIMPKTYIDSLINHDVLEFRNTKINKELLLKIIRSIARNESTLVSESTILKDVAQEGTESSRITISSYIELLSDLHFVIKDDSYNSNFRSPDRIKKAKKMHLIDPSLSCAALDLNADKLINDINLFGFMFEALAERDLRIYADYLNAKLYHFSHNALKIEVDAIIEFENGEYGAFEIKLSMNGLDDAIKSLKKYRDNTSKKPKFCCVIVGLLDASFYLKEHDIYVVPLTMLKP